MHQNGKRRDDGLVAVGGDLSPDRILTAYSRGIFPWYGPENPILWWSPDPRGIIPLDSLHTGKTLRRILKRKIYTTTRDTAFKEVMQACMIRPDGSDSGWITHEMMLAYTALHRLGHAHSIEVWKGEELVGGLYGVTRGGLFAGESMFHRESNASKVALVTLVEHMKKKGFTLLDCQMVTDATRSMGAVEISRSDYLKRLERALKLDCGF